MPGNRDIVVFGAGILGLWQALMLAHAGHHVRLVERSAEPFTASASRLAGAMLAPDCEAEGAAPIVRALGRQSLEIWRAIYPGVTVAGTLVVAAARDRSELNRFARMTEGHQRVDAGRIATLEPDLGDRFADGLLFAGEGHVETLHAMAFLLDAVRGAGVEVSLASKLEPEHVAAGAIVVDCRGLAARGELADLRGVRGERLVVATGEVRLARPVRLLHPRHPLYVVPWGEGRYMIGATVIESEDQGPATVRSALELLGLVYALHPAFGEARILDMAAGVRPAFPDNAPRIIARGRHIHVNGAFRHGFLTAPALALHVAAYLATGAPDPACMTIDQPLD